MAKPRKSKDENRMIVIFDDDPAVEEWLLAQKNRKASLIQLIKVTQLKYGNTDVNKMSLNDLLGNVPFSQHNNTFDVTSRNAKNKIRGKTEKVSDIQVKTDENLEKVSSVKETSSKNNSFSVDDDLDDLNNDNKQSAENNKSSELSEKKDSKKIDTSDKMLKSIMNF